MLSALENPELCGLVAERGQERMPANERGLAVTRVGWIACFMGRQETIISSSESVETLALRIPFVASGALWLGTRPWDDSRSRGRAVNVSRTRYNLGPDEPTAHSTRLRLSARKGIVLGCCCCCCRCCCQRGSAHPPPPHRHLEGWTNQPE